MNHKPDAYRVTIKYPSDLRSGKRGGTTPFLLDFVSKPITDFRLMYCDEETLRVRVSSGVCIIDFEGLDDVHTEIKVSSDSTLGEVLKKSGVRRLVNWRGIGQPYVVIIGKQAILAPDGTEQFLKTRISPGDFVVVQPVI